MTERKTIEEEIRRKNADLLRANRELEEFAYVASHDLQEPLRMVNIYTQLLVRRFGDGSPDAGQYAGYVRQGVRRMEELIKDLLAFSRTIHADELPNAKSDLSAALADTLSVLRDRIEETNASITVGPLPIVRGDAAQISQVFQNLLSNSLKYRRPDVPPAIDISAERNQDQWVVSVRDNGIGFDQQYAKRIFGLFRRLHKDAYPGTGLGLAICQRIVERYGGRIWADAQPGVGAAFHFTIPITASVADPGDEASHDKVAPKSQATTTT